MAEDLAKKKARDRIHHANAKAKRQKAAAERKRRENITSFTGVPKKMDDDTIKKIYTFLQQGLTVTETCRMAEISKQAYYQRQAVDETFKAKCEYYSTNCISFAKRAVFRELSSQTCDPKFALDYLKNKCKDEFGASIAMHHDGEVRSLPFGSIEPISEEIRGKLGLGGMDADEGGAED